MGDGSDGSGPIGWGWRSGSVCGLDGDGVSGNSFVFDIGNVSNQIYKTIRF
jgi:hypothetical protein